MQKHLALSFQIFEYSQPLLFSDSASVPNWIYYTFIFLSNFCMVCIVGEYTLHGETRVDGVGVGFKGSCITGRKSVAGADICGLSF